MNLERILGDSGSEFSLPTTIRLDAMKQQGFGEGPKNLFNDVLVDVKLIKLRYLYWIPAWYFRSSARFTTHDTHTHRIHMEDDDLTLMASVIHLWTVHGADWCRDTPKGKSTSHNSLDESQYPKTSLKIHCLGQREPGPDTTRIEPRRHAGHVFQRSFEYPGRKK